MTALREAVDHRCPAPLAALCPGSTSRESSTDTPTGIGPAITLVVFAGDEVARLARRSADIGNPSRIVSRHVDDGFDTKCFTKSAAATEQSDDLPVPADPEGAPDDVGVAQVDLCRPVEESLVDDSGTSCARGGSSSMSSSTRTRPRTAQPRARGPLVPCVWPFVQLTCVYKQITR